MPRFYAYGWDWPRGDGFTLKSTIFAQQPVMDIPGRHQGTVAEWLGRGLQNLVQRFESARYLQGEGKPSPFFNSGDMSKYSNWISFAGLALLTIACFLPWTYHA